LVAEDVPHGDLTTPGLGIENAPARMTSARVAAPSDVQLLVEALAGCRSRPVVAATGSIDAANAAAGAEVLVTSAPYNAPPSDVQVLIEPC
jgi:streptomycin 6-kinase